MIILNCNTFLIWITTYREKFHFGYFQRVCLMSAITEHIHSCHISVSLSSRKMKAYSSPERSYRRKKENHISKHFPLGKYSIKNQKTVLSNVITDTNYYKKTRSDWSSKYYTVFPVLKETARLLEVVVGFRYTQTTKNWIYTTSSTQSPND